MSLSPPHQENTARQDDLGKQKSEESSEMNDSLLKSFSKAQKEYIIRHIYPELSKALIHFISEAKRHNAIDEPNAFNTDAADAPTQSQFSAFGGYKLGQTQPSNMQPHSEQQVSNQFGAYQMQPAS